VTPTRGRCSACSQPSLQPPNRPSRSPNRLLALGLEDRAVERGMDHSGSWHSGVTSDTAGWDPVAASSRRPGEWRRRYRANVARLRSGERDQIAEVASALTERDTRYGLSQGCLIEPSRSSQN
jgi:hypothetical protein